MKAKVIFYDEKTGDIYQEFDRTIFIGKNPMADKNFVKVFVAFFRDVIEDEDLGKGAWRLLLYVVDKLDYDSLEVYLVPKKTAQELGITERTFYNWLKVLLTKNYITKLATNVYKLKPYTAIKGQMKKVPGFDFFEK
jgi:hypothetical protein